MGRKPNAPDSWHIAIDKDTKEVLAYHPSTQPEFGKKAAKAQYEEIGLLHSEEDAIQFVQFKEIGLKPDAVAFLGCEHKIKNITEQGTKIHVDKLMEMVMSVRKETGRTCFGTCRSLDEAPACATCYAARNQTWNLCACIKCLVPKECTEQHKDSKSGVQSAAGNSRKKGVNPGTSK